MLAGALVLGAAIAWIRGLCLPVSSLEPKWQCAATIGIVAAAYLATSFVAAILSGRNRLAAGIAAAVILFPVHTYLPLFGLASFGKRWYTSADPLLFAAAPAILGVAAALLLPGARHAIRRRNAAPAQ